MRAFLGGLALGSSFECRHVAQGEVIAGVLSWFFPRSRPDYVRSLLHTLPRHWHPGILREAMGKLRFKETESEREERAWRKEQRAKRKQHERAEQYADDDDDDGRSSRKHRRVGSPAAGGREKELEEEAYQRMVREEEERAFRARLFDEMGVEDGADGVQAMMGDYYMPDRWASSVHEAPADPNHMTDDEYAEWVRESMWRRTHAKEAEEAERRKKEREERKARDKARRRETRRQEKDAAADSDRRRRARDEARALAAHGTYLDRWARLHAAPADARLSFATVPWPVHPPPRSADDLTVDAIAAFLLADAGAGEPPKPRKQRLKEALLLWHPDRFDGRWLPLVRADDAAETDDGERERVRAAVGVVARHLNQLMETV